MLNHKMIQKVYSYVYATQCCESIAVRLLPLKHPAHFLDSRSIRVTIHWVIILLIFYDWSTNSSNIARAELLKNEKEQQTYI